MTHAETLKRIYADEAWDIVDDSFKTIFQKRLERERIITKYVEPRAFNLDFLSLNPKAGVSLNLAILNCEPTAICAGDCYTCQGRPAYVSAIKKSVEVTMAIEANPVQSADKIYFELMGRDLRFSGGGEMKGTEPYRLFARRLKERGIKGYGFTKRIDVYQMMMEEGYPLMFSIDASTPKAKLAWVTENVPTEARAFLAIPNAYTPQIPVAVIFPEHGPVTNNKKYVPLQDEDCPAVRGNTKCFDCRRCFLGDNK